MSVRVMSLVWDSTVPAPERFTLLALADRADEDGFCWPSIPTLARKCRTGESTVRRHLKALQVLGVLCVQHRMNDSSMYRIQLAQLRRMVEPVEPSDPSQSDTPPNLTPPPNMGGHPSQIDQTPPPNLGGHPSQSERLSIIDSSVDTSVIRHGARSARQPQATRLPDDFAVTPEMVAWARENAPHVDGRLQTDMFIDHWRAASGANARKRDWVAAWRNWMRKAPAATAVPALRTANGHTPGRVATTTQRVREGLALLRPEGN